MSAASNVNFGHGYQFIHLDWSSRIRSKRKTTHQAGPGKFRSFGWSAKDILSEAARLPGHCSHVLQPQPPNILYLGSGCESIFGILEVIDQWVLHYESQTGRKYRRNQPVMSNGVISFPRDRMEQWNEFRDASVIWLKEKYQSALRCVVEHMEEGNPHIHAYLVPQFGIDKNGKRFAADFGTIHAGYAASRAARRLHIETVGKNATSLDTGKLYTAGAPTRTAYVKAMRAFQDEFHHEVATRFSLHRVGPRAERLAYSEHKRQEKLRLADAELADVERAKAAAEKLRLRQQESVQQLLQIMDEIRLQAEDDAVHHVSLAASSAEEIRNAAYEEAKRVTKAAEGIASEKISLAEQKAMMIARHVHEKTEAALGEAARRLALANAVTSRMAAAIERVNNDPATPAYRIAMENGELLARLDDECALRMKAEGSFMALKESHAELRKDLLEVLEYLRTCGDKTFDATSARYSDMRSLSHRRADI